MTIRRIPRSQTLQNRHRETGRDLPSKRVPSCCRARGKFWRLRRLRRQLVADLASGHGR